MRTGSWCCIRCRTAHLFNQQFCFVCLIIPGEDREEMSCEKFVKMKGDRICATCEHDRACHK